MAYEFYVTVDAAKQGKLSEETPHAAHQGKITGISFHYSVLSTRDAATGMAGGKRSHQPVSFVKEWGAATPQLFQALCTNESLKSVLFEFVKTNVNGEEYVFHTIKLVNANVIEIDQDVESVEDSSLVGRPLEKISLTFQRIEIENKDGKTVAVDDARGR
jgi:type VI secretion system secreted protein Hcp